jgi:DNA-binding Lrp family transcriptional regulator
MTESLDAIDRALLAAVQHDARLPQAALGTRVGLSAAAVNRRLRRLADAGAIARTTAVLAPERVGYPLTVVAQVEVVSEQADVLDAMQASFVACPQVQQCYYVTGEWDFVLVLVVRDMEEYTWLTRQLFFAGNNVRRFKSLVVMDRAKVTLDVPVDGLAGPAGPVGR